MTIEFSEHPEYTAIQSDWILYNLLYEGNQQALKRPEYLWPHELESAGTAAPTHAPLSPWQGLSPGALVRALREQRSTYTNEIEPIISRWQSIFFKEEPEADEQVKTLFGDDIHDVTGDGKSLNTFIKDEVLAKRLLFGRPIIMTDAPDMVAQSLADQQAKGLKPFFRVLHPLEVKDWEIETTAGRKGQFKWLRYQYSQVEPRSSGLEKPTVALYSKMLQFLPTPDGKGNYIFSLYRLEQEDKSKKMHWVQVNQGTFAGFPNLPVRSIENEKSWIEGAAPLARKLYNLESGRDNILFYQQYQRTFIAGNLGEQEKMAMASYVIGFLPEGAVVHTIEPATTSSMDNNIVETRMNLRAVAYNQQRQVDAASKAVEGADTQREYKEALTSVVRSELETLENLVNLAIKDYAWFKEKTPDFKGKVTFNREIDLDDLVQEILFYQSLRDDIKQFPTWRKAMLKKFAKAQNLPEGKKIIDEIDTTEEPKPQQPPFLGRSNRLLGAINGDERDAETADDETD